MRVKQESGKIKDVELFNVTPENYIVPENEKHKYHVLQEVRKFDQNTGARLSVARIQKYGIKAFESIIYKNLLKQGYTVAVLHNPNDWVNELKENEQQKMIDNARKLKEAKASEAKAEAGKRQKEVDEAVAKAADTKK